MKTITNTLLLTSLCIQFFQITFSQTHVNREWGEVRSTYLGDDASVMPRIVFDHTLSFAQKSINNTYITRRSNTDGINFSQKQTFEINVSHLDSGMYFYSVKSEGIHKSIRFIKQ